MASKVHKDQRKNVKIQDKTVVSQRRMTIENQTRTAHSHSSIMPNRGDTGFTTRTPVGRRIYNGYLPEEDSLTMVTHHDSHGSILSKSKHGTENQPNRGLRDDLGVENELMNSSFEQEDEEGNDTQTKIMEKETRGPTYMQTIWGRPPNLPPIHVEYNDLGQPIGGEISKLCHFLGSIARNGKYCPIDVMNWHKMPRTKKVDMLDVVKIRFDVPVIAEKCILSSIGHKWRNWKHYLKTRYWDKLEAFFDKDNRVLEDQWINLVNHWSTEEAKEASQRNKVARQKKLMNQRTGKTSFAQIKARLTKEQGRCPTRVELFNSCFVSSNGNSSDAVLSKYAAMQERSNQLRESSEDVIAPDDIFAQIMGKDKPGHVRMLGQGICSSDVWSETSRVTSNRLILEYQAEIAKLRAQLSQQKSSALQVDARQATSTSDSLLPHATTTLSLQAGTYVSLESLFTDNVVAKGCVHSTDPRTEVGGHKIGHDWCAIIVSAIIEPEEQLVRPYDNFQKVSQTLGQMIAWPSSLVTPIND